MTRNESTGSTGVVDYGRFCEQFNWERAASVLAGDLASGINACEQCCDRYADSEAVALVWEGKDERRATYTFAQMKTLSSRFANFLKAQGVQPGDRVAGLLPRTPELLIVILGTLRAGAVYQPLFTAFGPKAIEYRVGASEAKLVVTDPENRSKLDDVPNCPPVMTVADEYLGAARPHDIDFWQELNRQPADFAPVLRQADDPMFMLFTSGTTGPAKGVVVPLKALVAFDIYMRYAVDLRADDVYWNIADPGWAYGLYYAAIGPLLLGHATTFYEGPFTAESTYGMIQRHGVTNLAGSPTAFRLLIAAGGEPAKAIDGRLRVVNSAGETLNPEVIRWFREHLHCPIYDHYGQTELGMVLCNHHGLAHPVHEGSAGFAQPGYRIVIVDDKGGEVAAQVPGILAVDRANSPVYWFQGYWRQPTPAVVERYFLTGDTAEMNADGSISCLGRGDDIITSSGYRIGPYDVESALIEHPAVMESAAVGKPDPQRTELVKAFVVLRPGYAATAALADELQQFVKQRLAAHAYPREIEFVAQLPKTPSGKIQRFILRNQEVAKSTPAR